MIINDLSFDLFSKIFKDKTDLVEALAFSNTGTVSLLLDHETTWHIYRGAGEVRIYYQRSVAIGESVSKETLLCTLDIRDFNNIVVL